MNVFLFCPKYDTDNPYYSPNRRLHALTGAVGALMKSWSAELLCISGGHRAPLKNNCEAVLRLPLSGAMTQADMERNLQSLLCDGPVRYEVQELESDEGGFGYA